MTCWPGQQHPESLFSQTFPVLLACTGAHGVEGGGEGEVGERKREGRRGSKSPKVSAAKGKLFRTRCRFRVLVHVCRERMMLLGRSLVG